MKRFLVCCGTEMNIDMETPTYIELRCGKCGDSVYLKKDVLTRPQLLDD
jgi:predicted nucleic-acid-binding Zn-ribbon protein